MLLICQAKVATNCQKVRVAHGTSAHPVRAICPRCALVLIKRKAVRVVTHTTSDSEIFESILKGGEYVRRSA